MTNSFTVKGLLGGDPELRFTPNGKAVTNYRVADTPRRYDQNEGRYVDNGPTLWTRCELWGPDAEAFAEKARKGDLVTTGGRMRATEWEDRETGQPRKSQQLVADFAHVHVKNRPGGGSNGGGYQNTGGQPASNGWGSAPTDNGFAQDDEPPF